MLYYPNLIMFINYILHKSIVFKHNFAFQSSFCAISVR